jgi:hypothetical protein
VLKKNDAHLPHDYQSHLSQILSILNLLKLGIPRAALIILAGPPYKSYNRSFPPKDSKVYLFDKRALNNKASKVIFQRMLVSVVSILSARVCICVLSFSFSQHAELLMPLAVFAELYETCTGSWVHTNHCCCRGSR